MTATTSPQARVRNTTATRLRTDNLKRLIAELRVRNMLAAEIASFFCFSLSGAQKYIRDLRDALVIEPDRRADGTATCPGKPVYRLSPDTEHVQQFVLNLDQPIKRTPSQLSPRSKVEIASRDPNRHFHIIRDDIQYPVRVSRAAVAPDPYALPRPFFASVSQVAP